MWTVVLCKNDYISMKKKIYVNSGTLQKRLHMYEEKDLCEQWYSAKMITHVWRKRFMWTVVLCKNDYTSMKKKINVNSGTLKKRLHMYEENFLCEQWYSAKTITQVWRKRFIWTMVLCKKKKKNYTCMKKKIYVHSGILHTHTKITHAWRKKTIYQQWSCAQQSPEEQLNVHEESDFSCAQTLPHAVQTLPHATSGCSQYWSRDCPGGSGQAKGPVQTGRACGTGPIRYQYALKM